MAPTSAYGASKLDGERAVAAANCDHVILRTAWVYAPYGNNFVRTMLALAEMREEVRVVADQRGCPTYAPDIAGAIIRIAHNLLKDGSDPRLRGIFHLAELERRRGPVLLKRFLNIWPGWACAGRS